MDLAAQVASTQTSEAKKAEEARKQSEQALSEVTKLESQSREAYRKQEYATAQDLMRQADQLRAELAQKTKESDAAVTKGKEGVNQAIQNIRESEDILNKTLDAESQAHQNAAKSALAARDQIKQTLTETETQIDQITAKLKEGLKVTLDADTSRFDKAIADLDKALAEKERLLPIKADLEQAQKKLQEYEQLLKEGKTLPVDADVSQAKAALDKLTAYAKESSQLELRISSEKAQASITNVEGMIRTLDRIKTESQHQINSNADAAKGEVLSLNGMHTSSTHTIYVTKVETNATGGLVGSGVPHFADGGPVASAFTRMTGGSVPGSGDQDTVPRTLDAGAFVLRKAAVRKYGGAALSRLANGAVTGVAKFATGGPVNSSANTVKRNKDAVEAQQMVELGMQSMREYTSWMRGHYGASLSIGFEWDTLKSYGEQAYRDRGVLETLVRLKQLTANERQKLDAIKQTWRQAMAQPLLWGKDVERDLMDYMEQHQGEFYRGGGIAKSDSVPAMLTPGEYVVNRDAVSRFGSGFFESLNNLTVPAQALAQRVQGQIQGFATGGLVGTSLANTVQRPMVESASGPARTVRVELAANGRQVSAQIDERDEGRLLQLLQSAQMRAA
jgi:phage-related minor tail protein